MKSTGTQTEQHHLSNDHARVDLDESIESLATTTSKASEWTPPEIVENNNLDNQESPPSHHSRKFIVLCPRNGCPSSTISLMFMKVMDSDFPNVYMVN